MILRYLEKKIPNFFYRFLLTIYWSSVIWKKMLEFLFLSAWNRRRKIAALIKRRALFYRRPLYVQVDNIKAHGATPWRVFLVTPLDNSPCSRVPLTYLESLLSVWCDPCPPWSQVACKLTSPSLFPPHSLFPPPTDPQSNYAPIYDDITTPTSLSSAQDEHMYIWVHINGWTYIQGTYICMSLCL
jgi:hypothetical protein